MFQLNLDGQQITQKIAGSGFGQPRFSREAIAEFQIVTNLFDITQGRSAGVQVQAISKSGTNTNSGSIYGFFRDDKLNAADKVAKRVLPYSNQQVGGTFGGPIVRDKIHYFASYEYEREPGTFFSSPSTLPGQTFTVPYKNGQKSFLARVDDQLTASSRLSVRGSRWTWSNPFVLGVNGHPSNASVQTKAATNILGTWSYAGSGSNKVHQIKVGYNNFDWTNAPLPEMEGSPQYDFPGLTIGAPYNFPQHPEAEQLGGPLRSHLEQGQARHQDGRRVHARAAHRRLVHPVHRALHDVERAVESRRADSARARRSIRRSGTSRRLNSVDVAPGSELLVQRLGEHHRLAAADLRDLVWRHLACEQSVHDQLRRPLRRGSEHGVGAERQGELDSHQHRRRRLRSART